MTRDELYASDRGEREYYKSKKKLDDKIRLPITKDGLEALMEVATEALDIPLDDTTRQVFAGFVHHLGQTENSTTLGEVGRVVYKNMANFATWRLDQDAKENMKKENEAAKLAEESKQTTTLTIAKEANGETVEQPSV